jgi:hypothetical protein
MERLIGAATYLAHLREPAGNIRITHQYGTRFEVFAARSRGLLECPQYSPPEIALTAPASARAFTRKNSGMKLLFGLAWP